MAGVLTRIRFVDGGHSPVSTHGSLDTPFRTIQAAVDAIGFPSTVGESAEDWAILIAPGDYDEDVAISGPVRLALIGLGAFRLGRYAVAGTPQTNIVAVSGATPRHVIWTYDKGQMVAGSAAPQLIVGTIAGTEVVRHGQPIVNRISGSIVVEGTAGSPPDPQDPGGPPVPAGGTAFLAIANTKIDAGIAQHPNAPNRETPSTQPTVSAVEGTINGTEHRAFSGTLVDRHFCSRFRGDIRGGLSPADGSPPPYVLATSFMAQYEKHVRVTQYASIDQAVAAANGNNVTVSVSPGSGKKIDGGNDFSLHPPTTPGTTSPIKLTSNDGPW